MRKFTIDNSVFLKIFLIEELRDITLQLFNTILLNKWRILNPTLFEYELYKTAITGKCDIAEVFDYLRDLKGGTLSMVSPNLCDIEKAKDIVESSLKNDSKFASFYDAIYHAVAINNDTLFITADAKYYNKTKHVGKISLLSQDLIDELLLESS